MFCCRCKKVKDLRLKEDGVPYKICTDCTEYRKIHSKEHALEARKHYYNHREQELERARKYRESHRDEINMKIKCDNCGSEVCKNSIARHKKTNKCMSQSCF